MKTSNTNGFGKKLLVSVLALALFTQTAPLSLSAFAQEADAIDEQQELTLRERRIKNSQTINHRDEMEDILTSTSYTEYYSGISDKPIPGSVVVIEAENYDVEKTNEENIIRDDEDNPVKVEKLDENGNIVLNNKGEPVLVDSMNRGYEQIKVVNIEGRDALYSPDDGRIVWTFEIPEDGNYTITMDYYPIEGKTAAIERILFVNGEVPFNEARYLTFSRIWKDDYIESEGFVQPEKFYKTGTSLEDADIKSTNFTAEQKNVKFYDENDKVEKVIERQDGRYFKYDYYGNEIRPTKMEAPKWVSKVFNDSNTFTSEPFEFFLKAGENTIMLDASREPVVIDKFTLAAKEIIPTYEEYRQAHKSAKAPNVKELIKIDAEFMSTTSDQIIYALNDRTSPITDPHHTSAIRLNSIGGEKWQLAGQWVEWEIEVPEDGLYYIVPRYMQNVNAGLFSSRMLYIDGKEPFSEARSLRFDYSDEWTVEPLGADVINKKTGKTEHKPYEFYLTKGTHTIRMEVVLGQMGETIQEIEESLQRLNEYYRKILMITGTTPDAYLDYNFDNLIPDVLAGMREEEKNLKRASAELEALVGEKGDQSVLLDKIAYLLNIMGNDQDKVAGNLTNYKSYIGSLGTWLLSARNQPLTLDYVLVVPASESYELPKANAGFFGNMKFEFSAFVNSFLTNYNSVGATRDLEGKEDALEVWITTGRDQAQIVRQMVTEFTKMGSADGARKEDYPPVNLKLIAAGTLLPATLAGMGPDVSMDGDPVSYGVRNAVLNLNDRELHEEVLTDEKGNVIKDENGNPLPKNFTLEELEAVRSRFSEAAFIPLEVYNPDYLPRGDELDAQYSTALYGLPETQSFSMMFYRKDIFVELGVEVPNTWDELYNLIRVFSDKNLEIGLNTGMHQTIMYQNEIPWYKGAPLLGGNKVSEGMATNLDSDEALNAFETMCDFFTQYKQPYTYDFANRFRTGEMPLGIADYTLYNQLTVFAPEIKGLWEFVQLPGTPRIVEETDENGNGTGNYYEYIDHTVPSGVGAVMIMKKKDNEPNKYRASWKYIEWWTDKDAQGKFGNEQVAIIGTAAKYNTANREALETQSWSSDELENIRQQMDSLQGTPMTPGNYIVARNQQFAFLSVYNDSATPSEAMQGYIEDINKELKRKRDEYDFRVYDETLEEYKKEQQERLNKLATEKNEKLEKQGLKPKYDVPVDLSYIDEYAKQEKEAPAKLEAKKQALEAAIKNHDYTPLQLD